MAKQYLPTPSQKNAIEKLKEIEFKNFALTGFVSESVIGSRNVLVMREYGKDKIKIYESYVIGPRGVINSKVVLPHAEQ